MSLQVHARVSILSWNYDIDLHASKLCTASWIPDKVWKLNFKNSLFDFFIGKAGTRQATADTWTGSGLVNRNQFYVNHQQELEEVARK